MATCSIALAQPARLSTAIDGRSTVAIQGSVDRRIRHMNDGGPVEPATPIRGLSFRFRPTPEQSAALARLLEDQQNPSSPRYHDWLTPEQFADRFGLGSSDVARITDWLSAQGFTIDSVARSRTYITFSGTAAQVRDTFRTELHRYAGGGETHVANASAAQIPAEMKSLIAALRGLSDFSEQSASRLQPRLNYNNGDHAVAPGDLAVIYGLKSLYEHGIDGTGQKIAIVGQSAFRMSDYTSWRSKFGLPPNTPRTILVPGASDPGFTDDEGESILDVDVAGGAAPNASILFVYSRSVWDARQYVIDENLAPVLSDSFGRCEKDVVADQGESDIFREIAQQANAQGITWLAVSGDEGPAACDYHGPGTIGENGIGVLIPASLPEVTGVGGTTFNEGSGNYWKSTEGPGRTSVISYIPETAWNDSAIEKGLASSSGGLSNYFPRPSWQNAAGVPNDNHRHVPDISFTASWYHDFYPIIVDGLNWDLGGTSAATPFFAGVVALLNHYLVGTGVQSKPGLGNINPKLYELSRNSSGVFHDVTTGNSMIPCRIGTPDCTTGQYGFYAGPGYDHVTGLGSLDATNLFIAWTATSAPAPKTVATSLAASANPTQISATGSTILTATVKAASGTQSPAGSVTFSLGTASLGTAALTGSGGSATASITVSGKQLASGVNTIAVSYAGSGAFSSSAGSANVTVAASSSGDSASMSLASAPAILVKNAKPDPECNATYPIHQVLTLEERNGSAVRLTRFIAGGNDWSDQVANWFGSLRLAPYGALTAEICWQFDKVPETYHFEVGGVDQAGHTVTAQVDVLVKVAGQLPGAFSIAEDSIVLSATGSQTATASLHLNLPSTEKWSVSILPANRTSNWLSVSARSGTGAGKVDLVASSAGLEKGVYSTTLVFEANYCVPSVITFPIILVVGFSETTVITGLQNAASFQEAYAPGMLVSAYGKQLANSTEAAQTATLPLSLGGVSATVNGIPAPLWFVSPGQINLQIPYETAAGRAIVAVNNNGQVSGFVFTVKATAPGIFNNGGMLTPSASAKRGSTVSMYVTGDGELSPMIDTGAPPPLDTPVSQLPKPRAQVKVTVGGIPANVVFIGNPWLVGITQINFTVPVNAPTGPQPVVVTVGGVSSSPALLNVQ
jgi:uncharacterized protein (TIGR03437 family)